jgi:hypothetical protein
VSTWQGCGPRGFCRRWVVQARTPACSPCTTVFDLKDDHRHVMVRPTLDDTFSILIDAESVRVLLRTIDDHGACAIPGQHARDGTWLLGLRPCTPGWTDHPPQPGPLELYVLLPDDEIHVIYPLDQLPTLHATLTEILHLMS